MADVRWHNFIFAGLFQFASLSKATGALTVREPLGAVRLGEETEVKLVVCGLAFPDRFGGLLLARIHYFDEQGGKLIEARRTDEFELRPAITFSTLVQDVILKPTDNTAMVCLEIVDVEGVFGAWRNDTIVRTMLPTEIPKGFRKR